MASEVEFSDEFGEWWDGLTAAEQKSVDFTVSLLQEAGPTLKMPHSSGVAASRHGRMRELRIQHEGRPYRVLYAFDPRRTAMLLIGGDKTETIAGMRSRCPLQMPFTTGICESWIKSRRAGLSGPALVTRGSGIYGQKLQRTSGKDGSRDPCRQRAAGARRDTTHGTGGAAGRETTHAVRHGRYAERASELDLTHRTARRHVSEHSEKLHPRGRGRTSNTGSLSRWSHGRYRSLRRI